MSNDDATPNEQENVNNPAVDGVTPDEPFQLHDAIVLGEIPQNVMDLSLTLGCGRNEQDKRWPARQMTWAQLVNTLSQHKVGKKEGTAFLQGSAIDNMRKANAIDALFIMGLDVDSGIHFDWAVNRVKELGLSAVLYTTHSHLKNDTFVLEFELRAVRTPQQDRRLSHAGDHEALPEGRAPLGTMGRRHR